MKLNIEGTEPLIGTVRLSGAKNAALKIIVASLFSNEDVLIENVPKIENVTSDLEIIKSLGGKAEFVSTNKLLVNASSLTSGEIPLDLGSKFRTAALLAGPLLYRFGKVTLPKPGGCKIGFRPINRWVETWKLLGFDVSEDEKQYYIKANKPQAAEIKFKVNTVMGTENAILSSIFILGETVILNAASEPEIDNLISFINEMGGEVNRIEERKIVVNGVQSFQGAKIRVMPDRIEAASLVVAALVTNGDVTLEDTVSSHLLPFMRKLEAMGATFEFRGDKLRVWKSKDKPLIAVNVETAPAPGFMTDWQPLITVLLTQAKGEGLVHDTIYTDRLSYIRDLNRMGAKITLLKPSDVGLEAVISDDGYDLTKLGEPYTVAKIEGPTQLKRERLDIPDLRAGAALIVAALCAEGRSEVFGVENVTRGYENFDEKLISLGAKISKTE